VEIVRRIDENLDLLFTGMERESFVQIFAGLIIVAPKAPTSLHLNRQTTSTNRNLGLTMYYRGKTKISALNLNREDESKSFRMKLSGENSS
jgi:hypothetical protein